MKLLWYSSGVKYGAKIPLIFADEVNQWLMIRSYTS